MMNGPALSVNFDLRALRHHNFRLSETNDPMCSAPVVGPWQKRAMEKGAYPPFTSKRERFSCPRLSAVACPPDEDLRMCTDVYEAATIKSPSDVALCVKETYISFGRNAMKYENASMQLEASECAIDTYFFTFSQDYVYRFSFDWTLDINPPFFFWLNKDVCHSTPICRGSNHDARTFLLDKRGLPVREYPPGEEVLVPAAELLQLSQGDVGEHQRIWQGQEALFPKTPGSKSRFPSWVWHSGVTLHARARCFSDDYDILDVVGGAVGTTYDETVWHVGASKKVPVCFIDIDVANAQSTDLGVRTKEDGMTERYQRAYMRVIGKPGNSFFRAWDANAILLFVTSSLVLLSLPKMIVRFFTLHCLGQLSKIYKSVIEQEFDISHYCARAVIQLASQSASFAGLSGSGRSDGLSLRGLLDKVRNVVGSCDYLDKSEIEVLVSFAFRHALCTDIFGVKPSAASQQQSFVEKGKHGIRRFVGLWEQMRTPARDTWEGTNKAELDIGNFCYVTGNEHLSLESIACLFDRDRSPSIGERLFMPRGLWNQVHEQHHDVEQFTKSQAQEQPQVMLVQHMEEKHSKLDGHVEDFSSMMQRMTLFDSHIEGHSAELATLRQQMEGLQRELVRAGLIRSAAEVDLDAHFQLPSPRDQLQSGESLLELPRGIGSRGIDIGTKGSTTSDAGHSHEEVCKGPEQALLEAAMVAHEAAEVQLRMIHESISQSERDGSLDPVVAVLHTVVEKVTTSQAKLLQASMAQMAHVTKLESQLWSLSTRAKHVAIRDHRLVVEPPLPATTIGRRVTEQPQATGTSPRSIGLIKPSRELPETFPQSYP